jgi:hypothetical protein
MGKAKAAGSQVRASERSRKRTVAEAKRREERVVVVGECQNPERRAACEAEPLLYLKTYWPEKFYLPFTEQQEQIVADVIRCIKEGGDQAIAAPRGSGKTTLVEAVAIYCLLTGLVRFLVICAASGPHANRILGNIKAAIESSDALAADYPEVVDCIRALEGAPQRAGMQIARCESQKEGTEERTFIAWSSELVVLPTVAGSQCGGSVLMTFGLDAAIRGVNYKGRRPDFVIIDDPETRESAVSENQVLTREQIIERDIAGLSAPGKKISRVLLTTIQNRKSLSYKITNRKEKPSWSGVRFALLAKKPEREDLWDEYCLLYQDRGDDDSTGRVAHKFYLDNRVEMDEGSEVTAPQRFIGEQLDDGTQLEASALQHCYNWIARIGWDAFCTEYQNDPPADENIEASGITANRIRTHLRGTPKGCVPDWATHLSAGVDVGKRALHWVVAAWGEGATGTIIDYGVGEVYGTDDDTQTEKAIVNALLTWRDETLTTPYRKGPAEMRLGCVLVDSGWFDTAVHSFTRLHGGNTFRSSKGFGQSEKMTPYKAPASSGNKVVVGNHWHLSYLEAKGVWLAGLDADYWKRWVHDRFLTPAVNADRTPYRGSLGLFGADDRVHLSFAKHLTAEVEKEEFVKGKGMRRFWDKVNRNNHWFDATYMSAAAASMCGIELLAKPAAIERAKPVQDYTGRRQMSRRSISFRR